MKRDRNLYAQEALLIYVYLVVRCLSTGETKKRVCRKVQEASWLTKIYYRHHHAVRDEETRVINQ